MLIEKTAWPQNKTCAAMISVNLDAEFFGKIYYPDVNVDEGDILRLGRTSLRYGLPKLLEVLDRYEVKATFFIPGAVVKRYPEAVASIVSAVSSQVYKKVISASADKIRDVAPLATGGETRIVGTRSTSIGEGEDALASGDDGLTRPLNVDDARYRTYCAEDDALDPALKRAHVRRHRKQRVKKQVLVVSVVSALLAIAVSVVCIQLATAGEGLGTKTQPIFAVKDTGSATTDEASHPSATKESQAKDSAQGQDSSDSSKDSTGPSSGSGKDSSSNTGSTSGSGDSDGSSDSGGDSSSSGSGDSSSGGSEGSGSTDAGTDGSSDGSSGTASSTGSQAQTGTVVFKSVA